MTDEIKKQKIIVVAGPTASGKTSLGISLANALNGEIISADSMQVYKGMTIATAAPTPEEKAKAVHHLTEILEPEQQFSVAQWCQMAREKIKEISALGKLPIIVGGTGLFIDSLVDNVTFEDVSINNELRDRLMKKDREELYDMLTKADPEAACDIHMNNKKRVVRALELYYSGTSKTQQNINSKRIASPYETLYFFINYADRQRLYDRINKRVDIMLENGLLQEAERAYGSAGKTSAQAIGHKELIPYFEGRDTLENCIENLKLQSRHYAKRQITWFKRRQDAVLLQPDALGEKETVKYALSVCEDFINGKFQKGKSE